ncbi:MAG TPA: hypothetical protein PLU35_14535, partial [Phycisphaerales bacterium]|nr:hypothetical protein [Phycisphaerales bacterium]
ILVQHYRPIGFGLVSLLILWKWIVAPQLAKNDTHIATMRECAADMKAASASLRETASHNDRTSERLDRMLAARTND